MAAVERGSELERWVASRCVDVAGPWTAVSVDASFRRYYRVPLDSGSVIAVDAPPEQEDSSPFVDVAERLRAIGVHVPEVLATDLERGFMLLSDLGSTGYLDALAAEAGGDLLDRAIEILVHMQAHARTAGLAEYDARRLHAELDLFPAWYVRCHLGIEPSSGWWRDWRRSCERLVARALEQPRVFVHRDYMPRNLMVTEAGPGVIDFQDAVVGPVTYDLVSLLRDAFISWPPAAEARYVSDYRRRAHEAGLAITGDAERFREDLDLMGAQRHLKVLGIFARLCYRDGKARYLDDAPRFFSYLARETEWPALHPLRALLDDLPAPGGAP